MIRRPFHRGSRMLLVLAGFIPFSTAARAEYVIFHNECKVSLVVQTASVVRGVLKRDQAMVKPGKSTARIPLDCDKVITICDGRTGRVLFRDPLRASKKALSFGIVADRNKVRVAPRPLPMADPMPGMPRSP